MTFRLIETADEIIFGDDSLIDLACDDAEHDDRFECEFPDGVIPDDGEEPLLIDDDDPADDAAIAAACQRLGLRLAELPY